MTLTLAGGAHQVAPPPFGRRNHHHAGATAASNPAAPAITAVKGVTNIDFKRGPNGEGRVIIDLTSTSISTDVWRENNEVNVELIGSQLPNELQRRMDVSDFATPISFIDTIQDGANIRMIITANGDFEHLAYQTDRVYTIEVAPISKEEEEKTRRKIRFHRRAPVAELPGHRGPLGIAAAGRLYRS